MTPILGNIEYKYKQTDLMVHPPKPGDPSYPLYEQETTIIFDALKLRSQILHKALNQMEGITCNPVSICYYVEECLCKNEY